MLKPSYSELMEKINEDREISTEITSRYIIVIAAAKRAREIIAGSEPYVETDIDKPVSVAVKELDQKKIHIRKYENRGNINIGAE